MVTLKNILRIKLNLLTGFLVLFLNTYLVKINAQNFKTLRIYKELPKYGLECEMLNDTTYSVKSTHLLSLCLYFNTTNDSCLSFFNKHDISIKQYIIRSRLDSTFFLDSNYIFRKDYEKYYVIKIKYSDKRFKTNFLKVYVNRSGFLRMKFTNRYLFDDNHKELFIVLNINDYNDSISKIIKLLKVKT
jgi:hypothetical protein